MESIWCEKSKSAGVIAKARKADAGFGNQQNHPVPVEFSFVDPSRSTKDAVQTGSEYFTF